MHKFNEIRPEFEGFSKFYDDRAKHFLEHNASLGNIIQKHPLYSVLAIVCIFALFTFAQTRVFAFILVFLGLAFTAHSIHTISVDTKTHIMEHICVFMGWHYEATTQEPYTYTVLKKYGLIPRDISGRFENNVIGQNKHNINYSIVESPIDSNNEQRKYSYKLISIEFERAFYGDTIVGVDKGFFNPMRKKALKRVGLVDPVFEQHFEVYSNDQVEARYILDPKIMQNMLDLQNQFNGQNARYAFVARHLHIILKTKNAFEIFTTRSNMANPEHTQKLLNQLASVMELVDVIHTQIN